MVKESVLRWGKRVMVEEVMLWWRKQCSGGGSNVMMKEAVLW